MYLTKARKEIDLMFSNGLITAREANIQARKLIETKNRLDLDNWQKRMRYGAIANFRI